MRPSDLIDARMQRYLAAAMGRSDQQLRERVRGEPEVFVVAVEGLIRRRREGRVGSA